MRLLWVAAGRRRFPKSIRLAVALLAPIASLTPVGSAVVTAPPTDYSKTVVPDAVQHGSGEIADAGRFVVAEGGEHGTGAQEDKKTKAPEDELPVLHGSEGRKLAPAEQYCASVGDMAASAQIANQRKVLELARSDLEVRIKMLSGKTEELRAWSKKRDEFLKKATENLVEIYSKMKPEIASAQLVIMNQMMAAAIVAKLSPKSASAILAEMEVTRAAKLSAVLAGSAEVQDLKPASQQQKDKP